MHAVPPSHVIQVHASSAVVAYFGEISSEEHGWPREEKAASFPNKFSHFKEEHIKKLQSEHVNTILIWGEQHTARARGTFVIWFWRDICSDSHCCACICTCRRCVAEPLEAAVAAETAVAAEAAEAAKAAEAAEAARRVMARGLRLFALYVAAGGALCMRGVVWRKIMPALHPDRHACSCAYSCTRHIHVCIPRGRGGDVRVFQHVNALKRQLDAGEVATHIYIYKYPLYILHVGCIGAAWCLLELGRSAYGALGTWRASPRAHLSRWLRLAGCEPSGDGGAD